MTIFHAVKIFHACRKEKFSTEIEAGGRVTTKDAFAKAFVMLNGIADYFYSFQNRILSPLYAAHPSFMIASEVGIELTLRPVKTFHSFNWLIS